MDFVKKLVALEKMYEIYDQFVASLNLACKKNCAHCCTMNVTLTTLEASKIIEDLAAEGKNQVIKKIQLISGAKRFKPQLTTNRLADLYAQGIDPPETCPFLTNSQCPIYAPRPFGCRGLVSRHDCRDKGYADVDDFVLSVNTVFLQTIEHVDAHGCTGNMLDVLRVITSEDNRRCYEANDLRCSNLGLIPNQPLKVLMIPPEHRSRMEPILQSLHQIRF
jgi:hypothetical protein